MIIVLEDDPILRDTLADYFKLTNRKYFITDKIGESIDALETVALTDEPTVFLIDVVLAQGDATPVMRYVKRHPNPRCRTVLMSAAPHFRLIKLYEEYNISRILQKPFPLVELEQSIDMSRHNRENLIR